MTSRIGGQAFDVTLGTEIIHVESISLEITDDTSVAQDRGIPNGHIDGACSAEGEIEVDTLNFKKISAAARAAGSYRAAPVTDALFYANTGDEELKIEVFGVKLILTSALSVDPKGGEKAKHKLKYLVTSPNFVRIDGVPVLSMSDVRQFLN